MNLAQRCRVHADKMDDEGWYVTANVLAAAADEIERLALQSSMLRIFHISEQEWQKANALRPPVGTLGVGSADFDHVLNATIADAYLAALRVAETPYFAYGIADAARRAAIGNHNRKRPNDYMSWQRDRAITGREFLDRIHAIATQK